MSPQIESLLSIDEGGAETRPIAAEIQRGMLLVKLKVKFEWSSSEAAICTGKTQEWFNWRADWKDGAIQPGVLILQCAEDLKA